MNKNMNEKNNFINNIYSGRGWSAPFLTQPDEINQYLENFSLKDRKIKHMRFIGLSYSHTRMSIEDVAFGFLKEYEPSERRRLSDYRNIDPDMQFVRETQIDEPLVIEFEDGDRFEIDTPQEPVFRMSMNCLPRCIVSAYGSSNVDANILFSPCIGKTISSVIVHTYLTKKDPMYNCEFEEPPYERELVSKIELVLVDKSRLVIGPSVDFCSVRYIDCNGESITMPFSELKKAVIYLDEACKDD